jgi:nucleoside-diphosphate-sugar epimerase
MTLIRTPFGFRSTAAEVAAGIDLTGKRAIVTGASSGIGVETARALAGAGAQVTLAVRNTQAGSTAAADIGSTSGREDIAVAALELTEPASVAADRLALRELFDAYVHCADRRDADWQKALSTTDTRFAVYMDGAPRAVTLTRSPRLTVAGTSPSVSSSSTGARRDRRLRGREPRRHDLSA